MPENAHALRQRSLQVGSSVTPPKPPFAIQSEMLTRCCPRPSKALPILSVYWKNEPAGWGTGPDESPFKLILGAAPSPAPSQSGSHGPAPLILMRPRSPSKQSPAPAAWLHQPPSPGPQPAPVWRQQATDVQFERRKQPRVIRRLFRLCCTVCSGREFQLRGSLEGHRRQLRRWLRSYCRDQW
jgi:hypothetical protein